MPKGSVHESRPREAGRAMVLCHPTILEASGIVRRAHGKHVWCRKAPPMDAIALDTAIKTHLADVRARFEKGLRIAKAAQACAVSGRTRKGMEVALGLEAIVHELNTILNAASMIKRIGKNYSSARQRRSASAGLRWYGAYTTLRSSGLANTQCSV